MAKPLKDQPDPDDEPSPIQVYLEKHRLTQEEFADQLGVSQGLIWQWITGRTRVTAERARDIEEKTRGKIKRRELRPDLFSKVRA